MAQTNNEVVFIMDKQVLVSRLDAIVAQDRSQTVKIFVRLLKQVWEIDWTVAAYDVMSHFLAFDIPYFYRFMALDEGDEAEEHQLIRDWVDARLQLKNAAKGELIQVMDEVNRVRVEARAA